MTDAKSLGEQIKAIAAEYSYYGIPQEEEAAFDAAIAQLVAMAESRSQKLADAGFTARDERLTCDECGKKFSTQMLPIHKCRSGGSSCPCAPEGDGTNARCPDPSTGKLLCEDSPPQLAEAVDGEAVLLNEIEDRLLHWKAPVGDDHGEHAGMHDVLGAHGLACLIDTVCAPLTDTPVSQESAEPVASQAADQRDALIDLDARLRECFGKPITAEEAYDSFYQQSVADALASPKPGSASVGQK